MRHVFEWPECTCEEFNWESWEQSTPPNKCVVQSRDLRFGKTMKEHQAFSVSERRKHIVLLGFFCLFLSFFFFFSLCMWGEWLLWKNVLSHQLSIKAKLSVSWDENYTLWAMRKTEESLTWYVNVRRDYDVMLLWGACYGNKFYYLVTFLVRKSLCSCLWRSTFSKR